MLRAKEAVRTLKEYHPPLGDREGLRLDFNENTAGCSPRVVEKLRELDRETLARYPERRPGEQIVAGHLRVSPPELLLTNGTDEAIHLLCETYLEPGDEAVIVVPTFALYEICAAQTGARVVPVPAGENFEFPTARILEAINGRTRFIAVANPNNPTGSFAEISDLIEIAGAAPQAALLVDEAYVEFSGETIAPRWREAPNLFVSRTFSKAYGMAGLRIGVLMGEAEQIGWVRRTASPYNLNSIALACLPAALNDQDYVRAYVEQTLEGRRQLESELDSWGVRFWPSRANFVLIHLGERSKTFISEMRARGILVRDRSRDYGCEGCVRITVGIREHNHELVQALREVFAEAGLGEKAAR